MGTTSTEKELSGENESKASVFEDSRENGSNFSSIGQLTENNTTQGIVSNQGVEKNSTDEIADSKKKLGKEKDEDKDVITVDDTIDPDISSKTVPDHQFFDSVTEKEKLYYEKNAPSVDLIEDMNIQCTACWKQVNHHVRNNIMRHPDLGVPICRGCKYFYEDDGNWEKDEQGSDSYCRWCANGGEMVCCDSCTNAICKRCIQRNLGRKAFADINASAKWECFMCDPTPIYSSRALMFAISKWTDLRKNKKRMKEKEAKKKAMKRLNEEKQSKNDEKRQRIENFLDESFQEAFDTLKIYQKCLEDEQKKWQRNKKTMTADTAAVAAVKLRKVYAITKKNMDLLDTALVQGYLHKFPEQTTDRLTCKVDYQTFTSGIESITCNSVTNGVKVNKRKMKQTASKQSKKTEIEATTTCTDDAGQDDIAVEEIVMNGEPILSNEDYFDPSQLCSIQITGLVDKELPKKAPVRAVPTGPLRISNKMFKKKSPTKLQTRCLTPDSDIEEIVIDDEDQNDVNNDSDVSVDL